MITLISGTNRPGSNTAKVAGTYSRVLDNLGFQHQLLSLESLPADFAVAYMPGSQSAAFQQLIQRYVKEVSHFIICIPEYNGSFPGIFKLFLDSLEHGDLKGKKVALVGVSTGRGGNLRGLDHLTGALHYLGAFVYPGHLPISRLRELLDANGELTDPIILRAMQMQAEGLVSL